MSIFRYEDVIFNLFPTLAHHKRRGSTAQEIFTQNDPFFKKENVAADKVAEQMLQTQSYIPDSRMNDNQDASNSSNTGFGDSRKLFKEKTKPI